MRLLHGRLLQIRGLELVIVRILDYEVRLVAVLLLRGLRVVMGLVLRDDLFDGDTLELSLAFCFDAFDLLVVREVLKVFGVVI